MGLTGGFLRRGSRTVSGFMYPISDQLACHFGPIFHKYWMQNHEKDLDAIFRQAQNEFIESSGELIKEYWFTQLESEWKNDDRISTETIDAVIYFFGLQNGEVNKIMSLVDTEDDPSESLPSLIIDTLSSMGKFNPMDEEQVLLDVGTIIYGLRIYGR